MDLMNEKRAYRTLNFLERIGFWELCLSGRQPFPPLARSTALRLREQLVPEIEQLEALTGLDLKAWKDPSASINRLETAPTRSKTSAFGGREIAAIALALIPLATGVVPDGLALGTMRFNPVPTSAVLEDTDDSIDDGMSTAIS
jgi:hypothetical protein